MISRLEGCFEQIHPPTRIVFGKGSVSRLPELVGDLGCDRALVVAAHAISQGPQVAKVRDALGDTMVALFDQVRPQAGRRNLYHAADEARALSVNVLVSVGGGSTLDSTKGIAMLLAGQAPLEEYRVRKEVGGLRPRLLPPGTLPHVAIPTTAGSSSEIMPWAGIRDEASGQKMIFHDRRLIPAVAILDPEMVAATPPGLTATSGITVFARAMEALYSKTRQPIAEAYALQALKLMSEGLPRVMARGDDLEARGMTLVGSLMSGIAADNAMASLIHAAGHVLGGRYALQHGIAHGLLLAPVARMCLPVIGPDVQQVAASLKLDTDGLAWEAAADRVADHLASLVSGLPIPRRLADVGVEESHLPALADAVVADPMFASCPRDFSRADVLGLLTAVW